MAYSDHRANGLISPRERMRLVALCATITGRSEVAEDVAQETLLEAWRHFDQLQDPEKRICWLAGIARNVCLRWLRWSHRDRVFSTSLEPSDGQEAEDSPMLLADAFDLEVELERKERIQLLEKALFMAWQLNHPGGKVAQNPLIGFHCGLVMFGKHFFHITLDPFSSPCLWKGNDLRRCDHFSLFSLSTLSGTSFRGSFEPCTGSPKACMSTNEGCKR